MPGQITIQLTDAECNALYSLSKELDLPQSCVMIMALRHYEAWIHKAQFPVCEKKKPKIGE